MSDKPSALVTGIQGFLGRHFARELKARGYRVVGIDSALSPGLDVRRFLTFAPDRYDLVIHCAGVVGGRQTIDGEPLWLATENLSIDAALFDFCRRTEPGRLLYLSSSAVYPVDLQRHGSRVALSEDDQTAGSRVAVGTPDATYGWVKLIGERLCLELRTAGVPVTVVRPFSGYGTDQSPDYPFPAFIRRAVDRLDPFRIWGSGDQVRDWIHVHDVVGCSLRLCEQAVDGPVNICSGQPVTMFELAHQVCAEMGYRPAFEVDESAPMGVAYRVGDPSRMLDYYTPDVTLLDGIRMALNGETEWTPPT